MIYFEALDRIRELASAAGAKLVAATKTRTPETISELHAYAPDVIMGENRAQELVDKYDPYLEWHMIGRLQTNKVKYVVGRASLIHSLDRRELAVEIDRRSAAAGLTTDCLIEVNVGEELSKGGVSPRDLISFADSLAEFNNIRLCGLMAVMPRGLDHAELDALYKKLYGLFEALKRETARADIKYLSAGMSDDFEIALANGANMLRIGRAIFGERQIYNATK